MSMLAIVLALGASLSWGSSNILAGSQTRRTSLWTVLLFSQIASLAPMALVALARGQALPEAAMLPALGAGLFTIVALAGLYRALALGVMGLVAPIFSLSTVVPVLVGLTSGERPSALQLAGIVIAVSGVLLASREKSAGRRHQSTSRSSIALAALSAVAYGFVMVLYAAGADSDPYWTVTLSRATTVSVLALAFVVMRPTLKLTRAAAAPILAIGVLEVGGTALFAMASTLGYLSIVSVLSSLDSVVVIILASGFLRERFSPTQLVGVVAALGGVAMIAAG